MMAVHDRDSEEVAGGAGSARERALASIREVKADTEGRMAFLFDGMSLNVEDALFEEMHGMEEQDALASHFNIVRAMRQQGALFRDEFKVLMNVGWVNLLNQEPGRTTLKPADVEVAAMISKLAIKTELRHKMLSEELCRRFSALIGRDVDEHPLSASNLLLAFWFSVDKLTLTDDERRLLLPLFDRFVMDRIGPVLAAANASLDPAE
tara:strand:+ start:108 stop:731 length:624 start_codon:yes stop_codon:yes gene_type:complete